jgi:hypothetical protein
MPFTLKYTLKHNHSSKTLECPCPLCYLHVSVTNLDHLQVYCSCCNATVRLVVFVTTVSGHVAVLSVSVVCTLLLLVLLIQQDKGTHDSNTNIKYSHMPR